MKPRPHQPDLFDTSGTFALVLDTIPDPDPARALADHRAAQDRAAELKRRTQDLPSLAPASSTPPPFPLFQHYQHLKNELPDETILLFRMGDFFEVFGEDAKRAAAVLRLTLTNRAGIPMAGIPCHAVDIYLARLLGFGHRVALADHPDTLTKPHTLKHQFTRFLSPSTSV